MKRLKIGTRGSKLALWQTQHVAAALKTVIPDLDIEIIPIKTTGDKILDVALSKIGDKGLFTKEIEKEILSNRIDIAVHSLKDLPSQLEKGLKIGAVLPRENPQDVLITPNRCKFADLPRGAVLGTSSLRRIAQIKALRPDIQFVEIRGNVETRLWKLQEESWEGIVLACAGVKRLGFEDRISDYLDYKVVIPAVGQGVIAVECRTDDTIVLDIIRNIHDEETDIAVRAERSFLAELEGGCQVPMAAIARLSDDQLLIEGVVASLDGKRVYRNQIKGRTNECEFLGRKLAGMLLDSGAGDVLQEIWENGGR